MGINETKGLAPPAAPMRLVNDHGLDPTKQSTEPSQVRFHSRSIEENFWRCVQVPFVDMIYCAIRVGGEVMVRNLGKVELWIAFFCIPGWEGSLSDCR